MTGSASRRWASRRATLVTMGRWASVGGRDAAGTSAAPPPGTAASVTVPLVTVPLVTVRGRRPVALDATRGR